MKAIFSRIGLLTFLPLLLVSCNKYLNQSPVNTTTASAVFSNMDSIKQALAKVYGAFALTSSTGTGNSDIAGIDPGTSDFLRLFWNLEEIPTDESLCAWNTNDGIPDLDNMQWSSSNVIILGLYARCIYQITVANSFLRQTENLPSSLSQTDLQTVGYYRAEARFLRAFQYWVLMNEVGNPPFVDENSSIGGVAPAQIKRADLFSYIVSELHAIDGSLMTPKTNEYGRADQAADWALLARVYLNANVYNGTTNTKYYDSAIIYSSKVIAAGYTLHSDYSHLFMADNNLNNPEVILSINYDGNFTQNYGGTTFIINGCIKSDGSQSAAYGVPGSSGWGGNRARATFPKLFGTDYTQSTDKRAKLLSGTTYNIPDEYTFTEGIQTLKFSNLKSDGTVPDNASSYASTDFPLFRLGEQYLIYAEAVLRGGNGGDMNTAVSYINLLRARAYGDAAGNITASQLTLPFILDERGRELYIECFRRTDLIRFGEFTTSGYLWPWKGGVANGKNVDDKYNIYPIPSNDITANPNLTQNSGY